MGTALSTIIGTISQGTGSIRVRRQLYTQRACMHVLFVTHTKVWLLKAFSLFGICGERCMVKATRSSCREPCSR